HINHMWTQRVERTPDTIPRSIIISTAYAEGLRPIPGDVTQLHQVLLNLCVNARDAMPDGCTLSIEAESIVLEQKRTPMQEQPVSGGYVVLSVSDTGTGMHPTLLDMIFEHVFATQ